MKKHAKKEKVSRPLVKRTSDGLRDALFDELDGMRNGTTTATNANAVARLADQICNTIHMEVEVQKYLSSGRGARTLKVPGPIALGT